jgi:hypothetical protein
MTPLRPPGAPTYDELRAAVIALVGFCLSEPRFDAQMTKFYGTLALRLGVDSPFLHERLQWADEAMHSATVTRSRQPTGRKPDRRL